MSAQIALAEPRRIKATHRRRRRIASGRFVQRYYDPQIGRLLSEDPVSTDSNSGGNFNRYWYANNNPYRFIDPDGRKTYDCTSGGINSCPQQIHLKPGDLVKTDQARVKVSGDGKSTSVTFRSGAGTGANAGSRGPIVIPLAPRGVSVDGNTVQAKGMGPLAFRDHVTGGGPWDYKRSGSPRQYEAFGNFNYGATGIAAGFPGDILLQEAGKYQQQGPNASPAFGDSGTRLFPSTGTGNYGDDPVDQYWIEQGIRYYETNRPAWVR